jgi:D-glycero-alpha-D-manno-heptose 1-phosphate guanylyltransferase
MWIGGTRIIWFHRKLMEAIILAGGFGTRLREVVPDLPKPMAPVAGRPFLEILLAQLLKSGFSHAVLALGYRAEVIQDHFGQAFGNLALSSVVESTPLGTGGATRLAMEKCRSDHTFIFNGDTFLDLDVAAVEHQWAANRRPLIVARPVQDTGRYGRLVIQEGLVNCFNEKAIAGPGLINAGCYVLGQKMLQAYPLYMPFSLETDYLSPLVLQEPVDAFISEGDFIDIGIPDDFHRAQTFLANYG